MKIINKSLGNIHNGYDVENKRLDFVDLQWFEATRRVQVKKSRAGLTVGIRFLGLAQRLHDGDVLLCERGSLLIVNILETKVILIKMQSIIQMSILSFEIGNRHIPLFISDNGLMMAFEQTIFNWLSSKGVQMEVKMQKLVNQLDANNSKISTASGKAYLRPKIKLTIAKN